MPSNLPVVKQKAQWEIEQNKKFRSYRSLFRALWSFHRSNHEIRIQALCRGLSSQCQMVAMR